MSIHVSLICSWINFMPPLSCVLKNSFYSLLELCVGWGGGRERRKRASHLVNRAYTHQILQFSYFLLGTEPIRGSHFSSFQHILPLKQYNG
jgi:hypothetical protein